MKSQYSHLSKFQIVKVFLLKCLLVLLPTLFVCALEAGVYNLLQIIQFAEFNAGYRAFNPWTTIDDWIPYITRFWEPFYFYATTIFWGTSFFIIYFINGEKRLWQYVRFCSYYFLLWMVVGIIFPSYCSLPQHLPVNTPSKANWVCWPSGHAATAYLPFMFTRKQIKKWYEWLSTSYCFTMGGLIIISTLLTKNHFFWDPIITITILELGNLTWYIWKKGFNPFHWMFANSWALLQKRIGGGESNVGLDARAITFRNNFTQNKITKIKYYTISWTIYFIVIAGLSLILAFGVVKY